MSRRSGLPSTVVLSSKANIFALVLLVGLVLKYMPHTFPAPWYVEELEESFVIRDRSDQALAHVDFEPDPNNEARRAVVGRLTREEARRIATAIAKLPTILTGGS